MKKVFALLFGLFAASQAFAQLAGGCTDGVASLIPGGGPTVFIRQDVLPRCSANVNLVVDQTGLGFAVASSSNKGKFMFSGNTGGGSIAPAGQCPVLPCTRAQLATPLGTALAAAT